MTTRPASSSAYLHRELHRVAAHLTPSSLPGAVMVITSGHDCAAFHPHAVLLLSAAHQVAAM